MTLKLEQDRLTLPGPIKTFWQISIALWLICAVITGIQRFVLHWGEPYNFPFLPFRHFCDFWAFHDRFDHYHTLVFYSTSGGSPFSYPAPLSLPYELFFIFPHNEHSIFTVATTLPLLALAAILGRAMVSRGISVGTATLFVASSFLFSYPFWFEYLLGNIEICVFLITAAGLLAWFRGWSYLAAVLIGIAGSMKIFPFFYLALFLSRKQYRQFACGLLSAAVLYPISIWMACPSFAVAVPGIKASSNALAQGLVLKWDWILIRFDHSLWAMYKQFAHLLGFSNERSPHELTAYTAIVAVSSFAVFFLRIRQLQLFNQLLILCVASVLFTPMSNDYTLLYLYVPWGLLTLWTIEEFRAGRLRPGVLAAFVCFGILFSPESELFIRHAALSGQIKAFTLIALIYIAFKYPFLLPIHEEARSASVELAPAIPAV